MRPEEFASRMARWPHGTDLTEPVLPYLAVNDCAETKVQKIRWRWVFTDYGSYVALGAMFADEPEGRWARTNCDYSRFTAAEEEELRKRTFTALFARLREHLLQQGLELDAGGLWRAA